MGRRAKKESTDQLSRRFFSNNTVFADCFNFALYNGQPKIEPSSLSELDPSELNLPNAVGETGAVVEARRDVVKLLTCKRGEKADYAILGIEEQTNPDCGMVIRAMKYDALRYDWQRQSIMLRNSTDKAFVSGGRRLFTGCFRPEDKVYPVFTLVVYLSHEPWSGARSLHELMDFSDKEALRFANDYKLNLIEPYAMSDEEIMKFSSDMRGIIYAAKYAHDNQKLLEGVLSPEIANTLHPSSIPLLSRVSDYDFKPVMRKHKTNSIMEASMKLSEYCKYLGHEEGRKEGREEGREEGIIDCAIRIYHDFGMDYGTILEKIVLWSETDTDFVEKVTPDYVKKRMALQGLHE